MKISTSLVRTLQKAQEIRSNQYRANAFASLSVRFSENKSNGLIAQAREVIDSLNNEYWIEWACKALAERIENGEEGHHP